MTSPPLHQVMSTPEVTTLLARIGAFDARTVGESEVQAWSLIAQRGRWTLAEATEQVIKFFEQDHSGWLMPGKINTMIRDARQDRALRAPIEGSTQPQRVGDNAAFLAMFQEAAARSKVDSQQRRALVLAHADLRQVLTSPLVGYSQAEHWNGWIPPERDSNGKLNDSPRRQALILLAAEAEKRANGEAS